MSEIISGFRSLLSISAVYDFVQALLGANRATHTFLKEHTFSAPNLKILDIGCGPGKLLEQLPPSWEYHGYDINDNYITHAKSIYKDRKNTYFYVNHQKGFLAPQENYFDLVLAKGVLHHLEDQEVVDLFTSASRALKNRGKLITLDGCYISEQSKIAKWLLSKDRGQNVRTKEGYENLVEKARLFSENKVTIRQDLLRVPYTHIVMELYK